MTTDNIRYWGLRIDKRNQPFFRQELEKGCLRMGFGWDGQDLRHPANLDGLARRNLRMLQVKQGDILIVPMLPDWHLVAIVEATENWDAGYCFDVSEFGDYGHKFPAKMIAKFSRKAPHVTGALLKSLRARCRFWSMDYLAEDIEELRKHPDGEITDPERLESAIRGAFGEAFDEDAFGMSVYDGLNKQFEGARWEGIIVKVLEKTLYPPPCTVEKVSGPQEESHGTDILISLPPGLGNGPVPVIAVQVKDWKHKAGEGPLDQIAKAEKWEEDGERQVVDKVVILTEAKESENVTLKQLGQERGVHVVFAEELQELLTDYGKRTMGLED